MARQTRQQRRERRAQQLEPALAGGRPPRPPRRPTANGDAQPARPEPSRARALPGSGLRRFLGESLAELKKVEWPGQSQVIQGTAVVLIACVIVGLYLWLNDELWRRFVENILLK